MRGQGPHEPLRPATEAKNNSQRPHRKVSFAGTTDSVRTFKVSKPMRAYDDKGTDDRHLSRGQRLTLDGTPQDEEATLGIIAPVDIAIAESAARQRAIQLQARVFPATSPSDEASNIVLAPLRRPSTIWLPKSALSTRDQTNFTGHNACPCVQGAKTPKYLLNRRWMLDSGSSDHHINWSDLTNGENDRCDASTILTSPKQQLV